jgi:hypothetical protein
MMAISGTHSILWKSVFFHPMSVTIVLLYHLDWRAQAMTSYAGFVHHTTSGNVFIKDQGEQDKSIAEES